MYPNLIDKADLLRHVDPRESNSAEFLHELSPTIKGISKGDIIIFEGSHCTPAIRASCTINCLLYFLYDISTG